MASVAQAKFAKKARVSLENVHLLDLVRMVKFVRLEIAVIVRAMENAPKVKFANNLVVDLLNVPKEFLAQIINCALMAVVFLAK